MSFRILYVEDDPINAYVLQKMLSNFTIDIAQSGEQGMLLHEKNKYDLILMDINLGDPEKDGVYFLKQLRQTEYGFNPIVAVTAYAMSGDRERFIEEGFDEYFSKPIEKLRLLHFIETKKIEVLEKY